MPSGLANGNAMVVVFFEMWNVGDHLFILIPMLINNKRQNACFVSSKLILMLNLWLTSNFEVDD